MSVATKSETRPSRKKSPSHAEPVARPTMALVRAALMDFLVVANRCLTAEQRGLTPSSEQERQQFLQIASMLQDLCNTDPLHVPSKTKKLTQVTREQMRIGCIRVGFDSICNSALRLQKDVKRDRRLAAELHREFRRHADFGVSEDMVWAAVREVRDRRRGPDPADEWLLPPFDDDVRDGKSKRRRQMAYDAAGEILEAILDKCPVKVDCGTTVGATSSHASRYRERVHVFTARMVPQNERLTLLATLLGVPLAEAPWVAFRIRLLLQGREMADLARPEWDDDWTIPNPTEFRVPSVKEWRDVRNEILRRLLEAGRPPSLETIQIACRLTASHLRQEIRGLPPELVAEPSLTKHPQDPFDSERSRRRRRAWLAKHVKPQLEQGRQTTASDELEALLEAFSGIPGGLVTDRRPPVHVARAIVNEFEREMSELLGMPTSARKDEETTGK